MADVVELPSKEKAMEIVKEVSPTGAPSLPQVIVKVGAILAILVGAVLSLPAAGVGLPPAVLAIAGLVQSLLVGLGVASQGVRK